MGLDMYLHRQQKEKAITTDGEEVEIWGKPQELVYWRKANAIHNWIDQNVAPVENCEDVVLTKSDIEKLFAVCLVALNYPETAEDLLPTQDGFFFGSTEYNGTYFDKLNYTVNRLRDILESVDFDNERITYYAWW